MSDFLTPDKAGLDRMLGMVVGEDAAAEPRADEAIEESHHALFIDREDKLVAICSCDMHAAAALGCALSMIPVGGAEDMVDEKELTGMAMSNLGEVMNIFSSLYMNDGSGHLRLKSVENGPAPALEGSTAVAFDLDLDRYGSDGSIVFRNL